MAAIPALLLAIFVHEAGHAFTTKHFGHDVPGAGVGWYWFRTDRLRLVRLQDMWLASRRQRILVSLASPYAEALLARVLRIAALLAADDRVAAALWSATLPLYISVLLNFNPLLEFDGYYILGDLLDRPNLRPRALTWIGQQLPAALRDRDRLRGHRVELLYGLASLAYVIAMAQLTLFLYRATLEAALASQPRRRSGRPGNWMGLRDSHRRPGHRRQHRGPAKPLDEGLANRAGLLRGNSVVVASAKVPGLGERTMGTANEELLSRLTGECTPDFREEFPTSTYRPSAVSRRGFKLLENEH